ncbi:MAG TPA: preprotein translocase subunit SecE [Actinomycetota bacterium]|nr:preprotein translocase subunit SecE [Actinomycetota bacterium]
MNRQTKRMMKKDEERKKVAPRPVKAPGSPGRERTKPVQFVREVVGELQKVAWPSRKEVWAYSLVVLVSSVVIAALIFGMDYVFTKGVLSLYDIQT